MATTVEQKLARIALRLRYLLWQRHRHNRLVLEQVAGHNLVILPGVMNPALFQTGEFLASTLDETLIPSGSRVLDMGTGSGIGAIVAARWAGQVTAIDINPAAVRCARINVLLNQVEDRVCVERGDLFAPVQRQQFDVMLFNPPFFRGVPRDGFDYAWRAENTVERFAAQLQEHLRPGGFAVVILSTDGDTAAFLHSFAANGFCQEVVARRERRAETLTIYRFSPMAQGEPCPQ